MLAVFVFTKVEFGQKRSYAVREVSREKSGIVRNVKISLSRKKKEREREGESERGGERTSQKIEGERTVDVILRLFLFIFVTH